MTLKEKLVTDWHIMRIFRFGIGLALLIMGLVTHDMGANLIGAFFLYQGVANTSCCGASACNAPMRRTRTKNLETETVYEEIK